MLSPPRGSTCTTGPDVTRARSGHPMASGWRPTRSSRATPTPRPGGEARSPSAVSMARCARRSPASTARSCSRAVTGRSRCSPRPRTRTILLRRPWSGAPTGSPPRSRGSPGRGRRTGAASPSSTRLGPPPGWAASRPAGWRCSPIPACRRWRRSPASRSRSRATPCSIRADCGLPSASGATVDRRARSRSSTWQAGDRRRWVPGPSTGSPGPPKGPSSPDEGGTRVLAWDGTDPPRDSGLGPASVVRVGALAIAAGLWNEAASPSLATASSGRVERLALPGGLVVGPEWSPEGQLLAAIVDVKGAYELVLAELVPDDRTR